MNVNQMLEELRQQHANISEAIMALERIAAGGKRRGRPPAWMKAARSQTPDGAAVMPKRRGRPPGTKNKPKDQAGA